MKLRLEQISRAFDGFHALDGVSLQVEGIHSLVLVGPSGGGKSTLLRILAGLETPDSGILEINGERLGNDEPSLLKHRRKVGVVFQSFNLFPHLSALENITLPLTVVQKKDAESAQQLAQGLLERFELAGHAEKKPAALSGGQRQRVAIARALATQPSLLILDEPTSALDPSMTAEVLDTIELLRQQGRDFILATHEMNFARRVADRIALVCGGKIAEVADPASFFETPKSDAARAFLARFTPNQTATTRLSAARSPDKNGFPQ